MHNLDSLSSWAEQAGVYAVSPCAVETAVRFFKQRADERDRLSTKTFKGERDEKLLMIKFVKNIHWHQLLLFPELKQLCYHEPFGGSLHINVPEVKAAFEDSVGPTNGWSTRSIRVALQSCDWECGA